MIIEAKGGKWSKEEEDKLKREHGLVRKKLRDEYLLCADDVSAGSGGEISPICPAIPKTRPCFI